jgi:hypothetical protein
MEGAHLCTGGLDATHPICDGCPAAYEAYSKPSDQDFCPLDDVMYCCKAPAQGSFTYTYFYSDCTNCDFAELDAQCKSYGSPGLVIGLCELEP